MDLCFRYLLRFRKANRLTIQFLAIVMTAVMTMGSSCGKSDPEPDLSALPCEGAEGITTADGGFIADTASVTGEVIVANSAEVCDNALVTGFVEIRNRARVAGNAEVIGSNTVAKSVLIYNDVEILDNALVTPAADARFTPTVLMDRVTVANDSEVVGAQINGNTFIGRSTPVDPDSGDVDIPDNARRKSQVLENVIINGNYNIIESIVRGNTLLTGVGDLFCAISQRSANNLNLQHCFTRGELRSDQFDAFPGSAVVFAFDGAPLGDLGLTAGVPFFGSLIDDFDGTNTIPLDFFVLDNRHFFTILPTVPVGSYSVNVDVAGNAAPLTWPLEIFAPAGGNALGIADATQASVEDRIKGLIQLGTDFPKLNIDVVGLSDLLVNVEAVQLGNFVKSLPANEQRAVADLLDANIPFHGYGAPPEEHFCGLLGDSVEDNFLCALDSVSRIVESNDIDRAAQGDRVGQGSNFGVWGVAAGLAPPLVGLSNQAWVLVSDFLGLAAQAFHTDKFYARDALIGDLASLIQIKETGTDQFSFNSGGKIDVNPIFYDRVNENIFLAAMFHQVDNTYSAEAILSGNRQFCEWSNFTAIPLRVKDAACRLSQYEAQYPGLNSFVGSFYGIGAQNRLPSNFLYVLDPTQYNVIDQTTGVDIAVQSDPNDSTALNLKFTITNSDEPIVNAQFRLEYLFFSDFIGTFDTEVATAVERPTIFEPSIINGLVNQTTLIASCVPGVEVVIDGSGVNGVVAEFCPLKGLLETVIPVFPGGGTKDFSITQSVLPDVGPDVVVLSDTVVLVAKKCAGNPSIPGDFHANGGGFREAGTIVDSSAFISEDSEVCDQAQVLGNARIEGNSFVYDQAVVSGNATIRDHSGAADFATVFGSAIVEGFSRVLNGGIVDEGALVGNFSQVLGLSQVTGGATVIDDAIIADSAVIFEDALVRNAIVEGEALVFGGAEVMDLALVRGQAEISGSAQIRDLGVVDGNALVSGDAEVYEDGYVTGFATVHGLADVFGLDTTVFGNAEVTGDVTGQSQVSGDAKVLDNAIVTNVSSVFGFAQVTGDALVSDAGISGSTLVTEDAEVTEGSIVSGLATVQGSSDITGFSDISGGAFIDDADVDESRVFDGATVLGLFAEVIEGSAVFESATIDDGDVENLSCAHGSVLVSSFGTLDFSIVCTGEVDFFLADFVEPGCFCPALALKSGGGGDNGRPTRSSYASGSDLRRDLANGLIEAKKSPGKGKKKELAKIKRPALPTLAQLLKSNRAKYEGQSRRVAPKKKKKSLFSSFWPDREEQQRLLDPAQTMVRPRLSARMRAVKSALGKTMLMASRSGKRITSQNGKNSKRRGPEPEVILQR